MITRCARKSLLNRGDDVRALQSVIIAAVHAATFIYNYPPCANRARPSLPPSQTSFFEPHDAEEPDGGGAPCQPENPPGQQRRLPGSDSPRSSGVSRCASGGVNDSVTCLGASIVGYPTPRGSVSGQLWCCASPTEDVRCKSVIGPLSGYGSSGYASLATCTDKTTLRQSACKVVDCGALLKSGDAHVPARLAGEVAAWVSVSGHPSIARLQDVFESRAEETVHLVHELCTGGSLADFVRAKGPLDESTAASLFRGIANAVLHCHKVRAPDLDVECSFYFLRWEGRPSFFYWGGGGMLPAQKCAQVD